MLAKVEINHNEKTDELIITVKNLRRSCGISKSGNSEIIATTHGSITIGDGLKVSLNVYKPVKKY